MKTENFRKKKIELIKGLTSGKLGYEDVWSATNHGIVITASKEGFERLYLKKENGGLKRRDGEEIAYVVEIEGITQALSREEFDKYMTRIGSPEIIIIPSNGREALSG
ncbi:hypothetical protein ACFLTA_02460 [Bacteroidota bacterium]